MFSKYANYKNLVSIWRYKQKYKNKITKKVILCKLNEFETLKPGSIE